MMEQYVKKKKNILCIEIQMIIILQLIIFLSVHRSFTIGSTILHFMIFFFNFRRKKNMVEITLKYFAFANLQYHVIKKKKIILQQILVIQKHLTSKYNCNVNI